MKRKYKFIREDEEVYNVRYDQDRGVIKYYSSKKEGQQYIYLTKQQIIMFNVFLKNGQDITTKKELFRAIYKIEAMNKQDDVTMNLSICRLRKRIEPVANIISKKGVGFILEFKGVEK